MLYGSNNRYEVQIDNVGRMIKGITYSYGSNGFYGKSSIVGMWTPTTKNIIFKEDNLLDYKNADKDAVEMFTCYLEYRKEGDKEILEGDFNSVRYKTDIDGASGKIYLERTTVSHFKKEPFILRKEKEDSLKTAKKFLPNSMAKKIPLKNKNEEKKPATSVKQKPTTNDVVNNKPKVTPPPVAKTTPKNNNPVAISKPKITQPTKPIVRSNPADSAKRTILKPAPEVVVEQPKKLTAPAELPKVLKERTNELFKTIPVSANEIEVDFYDNGEVDGDTISVYLNGRLLASHRGLTTEPITFKIKIDADNPEQEIVMVAENLGTIPPNTALMIAKFDGKRYDVNLSSNEQKNAMVRFKYQKE